MASIKNLKKDLNYIFSDIIEECYVWQLENGDDKGKAESIIDGAISSFDALIERINTPKIEDKNPFFYPLNSVDKLGQFEILAHKNSLLYKKLFDKEEGHKVVISGPYGTHKYLGMGRFYK